MSGRVTMSADRIAASVDQPETASANGSRNCSMTLFIFRNWDVMLPPVRAPQPERDRRWQRDAYGFGSLPEKKGNPAVCFLIFMSIGCHNAPLPASESRFGYAASEAKGAGQPSLWTTNRQSFPPDKLHHDQRKKMGAALPIPRGGRSAAGMPVSLSL
jgi:hypothetical protein